MQRTNRSVRAVKIGTGGGGERATWARPKSGMVPSPASLMAARQQAKAGQGQFQGLSKRMAFFW